MRKSEIIKKYKKDRHIQDNYKLDEDEMYLIEEIQKALKQGQLLPIDSVSEPLIIDNLTIHPIDEDGEFEIELDSDNYRYINSEQAKVLIKYLQDSLNAR